VLFEKERGKRYISFEKIKLAQQGLVDKVLLEEGSWRCKMMV
jgi:hypothetical protein